MMTPRLLHAKLEDKLVHNPKHTQFMFELIQPHQLEFMAGQYVSIKINDRGERRSYSICSSPNIKHGFELLVDLEPQGQGSQYLQSLQFGDQIDFLAPLGQFIIASDNQETVMMMVASGSGIAPFRSMIQDLLQEKRDTRTIILHWGMRFANQLFWLDELEDLMDNFPNFTFHPVISQPSPEWTLSRGRVTDVLKMIDLPVQTGYYLCGSQPMIIDCQEILKARGVAQDLIHYEKFY